jgi:hypothetical protein
MYFKSKKVSLLILGITSLICSRGMFALFNDPEGPNLLIVAVGAVFIYLVSLAAYLRVLPGAGLRRLLLGVLVQLVIVSGLYLLLN